MKSRAAGPASGLPSHFFSDRKGRFPVGPPPPSAAPQSLAPGTQAQSFAPPPAAMQAEEAGGAPLTSNCGRITDSRGNGVSGASITILGAHPASSKSGPDGRYCVPASAGDTLVVLHVGFEPARIPLAAGAGLDVDLEPIGTLGPEAGMALARPAEPRLAAQVASGVDVYAGATGSLRTLVDAARGRTDVARRGRNAGAWERAARAWEKVIPRAGGAASLDARFQFLTALREEWRIDPNPDRERAYRGTLAQFLVIAPAGLPARATALQWRSELPGGGAR